MTAARNPAVPDQYATNAVIASNVAIVHAAIFRYAPALSAKAAVSVATAVRVNAAIKPAAMEKYAQSAESALHAANADAVVAPAPESNAKTAASAATPDVEVPVPARTVHYPDAAVKNVPDATIALNAANADAVPKAAATELYAAAADAPNARLVNAAILRLAPERYAKIAADVVINVLGRARAGVVTTR